MLSAAQVYPDGQLFGEDVQTFEQVLVVSEHLVPFVHGTMTTSQRPELLQVPLETSPPVVQVDLQSRLGMPVAAFVQVPGVALHVRQSPEQASLQQKLSTQNPLSHSVAWPHTPPMSTLHVLSAAHLYPVGHGTVGEHAFVQAPAEQWLPPEQGVLLFSLHWPVPSQDRFSAVPSTQVGVQVPLDCPAATLVQRPGEPAKPHDWQTPSPHEAASQQ